MKLASLKSVLMMGFAGLLAVAGGVALTHTLTNSAAAWMFGYLGGAWLLLGMLSLVALVTFSKTSTTAYLLCSALNINIGCTTMCLAISTPLLFLYDFSSWAGRALVFYFVILMAYQTWRTRQHFLSCWQTHHQKAFAKCYDTASRAIHIENFLNRLHTDVQLFLPVRSLLIRDIVYLLLILSMVGGLNFRKAYPEASAIAWGIPAFTFATVLVQLASIRLHAACELRKYQIKTGVNMVPID